MIPQTSPEIGGMGHSVKRKEDARFLQGKGNYVDDVHLPGMVFGQVVRKARTVTRGSRASTFNPPCRSRARSP